MENKTEFEKIGVKVIEPKVHKGRWVFEYQNVLYDMAPALLTDAFLSPMIAGADRLIRAGCQLKGIPSPDQGFYLLLSENLFPQVDVKLTLKEPKFNGLVYNVESINLDIPEGQQAWLCPYLKLYFPNQPNILYAKMEKK